MSLNEVEEARAGLIIERLPTAETGDRQGSRIVRPDAGAGPVPEAERWRPPGANAALAHRAGTKK